MTARTIVADVFLVAAVLIVWGAALGLLLMRGVYRKTHFVTPISLVAPILVAVAVTVQAGYHEATAQTWLAVGILCVAGPILCHATVRAARIHEEGDWRNPRGSEAVEDPS